MDRFARHMLVRQIQRQFYTWDRARLEEHQAHRLKIILSEVARRSPYYANLSAQGWDGQLASLPLISKQDLVAHFDQINTAGLHSAELSQFAVQQERIGRVGLYQGRYSVGLSSGTSGNKLVTVLSRTERWNYACLLSARSGIPDEVRNPRVLFALRVNNPAFMETRALGVTLVHVDYTHPPEKVIDLVNQRKLNILAGPPSLLRMLIPLRGQIRQPVEGVISYAEVLDDATRTELEAAFGVRVAQIYQGAEGFIGSTCRKGRLHLNEDTLLIEKIPALEDGEEQGKASAPGIPCKLVVTDLYRLTQPFLRYSIEDLVDLSPEPCECGSCFQVIERIHGRTDDIFLLRRKDADLQSLGEGPGLGGGEVRSLFPDYVTRSINQASDAVLEFQALQYSLDDIEIRLILKPGTQPLPVQEAICANLGWWADKAGGRLGRITFTQTPPERNPNSRKLIRVVQKGYADGHLPDSKPG